MASFWSIQGPEGGLTGVLKRAKQFVAGAAETTIANTTETNGNYRPAIVDAVPATVGVIAQLIKGKKMDGSNVVERVINNSMRRSELGSQRTNATLGIEDPKNTAELGLRILGGVLGTPAVKAPAIARAISKLPKGTRTAAKVITEVAAPLRQTSVGTSGAIGLGFTGVLDAALDKQEIDPTTGERFDGTVPELFGVDTATPEPEVDPEIAELEQFMYQAAVEDGEIDELASIESDLSQEITDDELVAQDKEDELSNFQKAALTVGGLFAGGAAIKYASHLNKAREAAAVAPENIAQFTGKKYKPSRASKKTRWKAATVQQDEPIREAAEDFLGRDYAQRWGFKADRMTNVGIAARVHNFNRTGAAPGTNIRTPALAPIAEAFAKELSREEQLMVSDALLAASALDDYRQTGTLAALNKDKWGQDVTPAQLEMLVQRVTSDPKQAKYFDAVQKTYDDLLRYRVARGRMTPQLYTEMREKRPNYVPFNRNLDTDAPYESNVHRYSANDDTGMNGTRATDEGASVSGERGVGSPFVSMFDDWANEIRRADLNDQRADFLINMDAAGALNRQGDKIIHELGGTPNGGEENVHRVFVNGKSRYFRVNDPLINRALHMSPRATIAGLEAIRGTYQSMTTGSLASVFNLFTAIKSPMYDMLMANVTRPKGQKIGAANRALVGGYTGALRYLWDDMRGGMATTLREAHIRNNSMLKNILGDQGLDALATKFENIYENTLKAEMDTMGITSHTAYGSPDPSNLNAGITDLAPHFAASVERINRNDLMQAFKKGEVGPYKAMLEASKSGYVSANANMITRAIASVVEALHNGTRYTAHAASRNNIQDLDEHISNLRRLSADPSQHGGNDALNKTLGSLMYGNLGVQTLYEVAKRAKQQPTTWLLNMTTLGTYLGGLWFLGQAYDPVAQKKHQDKTPTQKMMSITVPGGGEIDLDPITRLFMGPTMALLEHYSGIDEGKPDRGFMTAIHNLLEGDAPLDEATLMNVKHSIWESIKANDPSGLVPMLAGEAPNYGTFPLAGVAAAAGGVDPGMSRIADEIAMERKQKITAMEVDVSKPDSIASARWQGIFTSAFSTTGRAIYDMADALYRAYGKSGDLGMSVDVAADKWKDTAAKGAGLFRPILFGDHPSVVSASDENFELLKEREPGIEQAIQIVDKDYRNAGRSSATSRYGVNVDPRTGIVPEELQNTELIYIAQATQALENQRLSKNREILNNLARDIEKYQAGYGVYKDNGVNKRFTQAEANEQITNLNKERKYQRMLMLTYIRDKEAEISATIGRPFTYRGFDPRDYTNPLQPAQ